MTTRDISFQLYRADLVTPSRGSIMATPTRRHNSGTMTVLPTPVQIPINGVTVHALEVPGTDWCWEFRERVNGGDTRYCTFVDGTAINYKDLTDIDPVSFLPSAVPPAAWWVALAAVGGGGLGAIDGGSATGSFTSTAIDGGSAAA